MRIGIVTGEYPPMQGGVGAYTHILAQELMAQGAQIHLFSAASAESQNPELPLTRSASAWDIRSLFQIKEWTRAHQLDLLNLQFQTAAYQMSPWIHLLPDVVRSLPVVCTFHDLRVPYLFPKAGPLRKWMVMHLARRCQGVIVTNYEDQQQVSTHLHSRLIPIGSNILTTLNTDFDTSQFRAQNGLSSQEFIVGYFGLINHSKGLEELIRAVKMLCAEHVPIKLVMIGGGSGSSDTSNVAYLSQIQAEIKTTGIENHVHWTGYLDEQHVASWLRTCDATALPFRDGASFRRGSLMAAIHYGCPIVSTQPSIAIPAFQHGETMHLVSPGDAQALAEGLRLLYTNPSYAAKLQHGATTLRSQFSWSQIAADTLAFFTEVA